MPCSHSDWPWIGILLRDMYRESHRTWRTIIMKKQIPQPVVFNPDDARKSRTALVGEAVTAGRRKGSPPLHPPASPSLHWHLHPSSMYNHTPFVLLWSHGLSAQHSRLLCCLQYGVSDDDKQDELDEFMEPAPARGSAFGCPFSSWLPLALRTTNAKLLTRVLRSSSLYYAQR